jgi:hypothetical protein
VQGQGVQVAFWRAKLQKYLSFLPLRFPDEEIDQVGDRIADAMERQAKAFQQRAAMVRGGSSSGETIHQALDVFLVHKITHKPAEYARNIGVRLLLLKRNIADAPLSSLTADKLDQVLAMFAARPLGAKGDPLRRNTIRHTLSLFREFVHWLDRSEFSWEQPRGYFFPRTRIKPLVAERVKPRRYFKIAELRTIWEYASPWERALICLSLNCGFSKRELATLQQGEIVTRKDGKYIARYRHKTDVYGEWLLWEETIQALDYLQQHKKDGSPFVLTKIRGGSLDGTTASGNESPVIRAHWDRLMKRIKKDDPSFYRLPYSFLRKTGATLIRRLAKKRATELASMYLSHGERRDSDDPNLSYYAGRHWRLLHRELLRMRSKLQSVFNAVKNPWSGQRVLISPRKREEVLLLKSQGLTRRAIAAKVGLHRHTVGKILK